MQNNFWSQKDLSVKNILIESKFCKSEEYFNNLN